MTKTGQNRVLAWRLELLLEASAMPRNVARQRYHFGRKLAISIPTATPGVRPDGHSTGERNA